MAIVVYKSNRLENLFSELENILQSQNSNPLQVRSLVVPSPAMRWWVQLQLAERSGVCALVKWLYLDEVADTFFEKKGAPTAIEQSFAIEQWLRKHRPMSEKKITPFAEQISGLFRRYGLFGKEMLKDWNDLSGDWQQELWFDLASCWENSGEVWQREVKPDLTGALHLFGVSFFAPCQLEGLKRLSDHIPVYLYLLSPTALFWGDVTSDLESEKIQMFAEKKGTSAVISERLEELLSDQNRLLGNFGRIGRELSNTLVDLDLDSEECFSPPEEESLLGSIQRDFLEMRNLSEEPLTHLAASDCSIELHSCPSPLREVEALYDKLFHLVHTKKIESSDVVVMAPDITPYAPYLKMVFGEREGGLKLRMLDLPIQGESCVVYGFKTLLEFATSRWESTTFLELLSCEPFREAVGIDRQQVVEIRTLLKELFIRWGFDEEHRKSTLEKKDLLDPEHGTWTLGLDRLIDEQLKGEDVAIDCDQLGRFVELLYSLREDLKPLISEEPLELNVWVDYFHSLLDSYFMCDGDIGIGKLRVILERFRITLPAGDSKFSFFSVRERLLSALNRESCGWREWAADGVRCCSLLPMRAVPAKVVCLLGLSDGAYPRAERRHPHDRLIGAKKDYDPDRNDFDRYLFLEALLSARSYFLMSYSTNSLDGGEQGPSLLLREIFDYCDKGYRIGEKPPSEALQFHHPSSPFASIYFEENSPIPSYSHHRYEGALVKQKANTAPFRTIDCWLKPGFKTAVPERMTISDLLSVARHPLRYFLQKSLGLYLKEEKEPDANDSFSLTPLQHALFCRDALRTSSEKAVFSALRRGILPPGPFRNVAIERFSSQIAQQQESVEGELFLIELRGDCSEAFRTKEGWILPALQLDGTEVIGILRDVSKKGIPLSLKNKTQSLFRLWPAILIQVLIGHTTPGVFSDEALVLPKGLAECSLKRYIAYAAACETAPSLLFPEWIPEIRHGSVEKLQSVFETMVDRYHDPYLKWAFAAGPPSFEKIIHDWKKGLEPLLEGMDALV